MTSEAPVPPHSIEAEQAVIGAVIMNQEAFDVIERKQPLVPADFFEPLHQFLWERFQQEHAAGHRLDYRLAMIALGAAGGIAVAQSTMTVAKYAAQLAAAATTVVNAPDYARTIASLSARRKLIDAAEVMLINARSDMSPAECANIAIETIDECAAKPNRGTARINIFDAAERSLQRMQVGMQNKGRISGVSTGVYDLDMKTGGLQPGDLIILAGRPGMGKSGVAVSIARAAAFNNFPTLYFSLEMGEVSLADRVLAEMCFDARDPVTYESIARGTLSVGQATRVIEARRRLVETPFSIEVQGGLALSQIATRARKHNQMLERKGMALGLLIVDHMHIMSASNRYAGQRVNEVTEISAGLKALAKELGVPVLALAQLSRQVEARDNKRPGLSDLRESGAIEQDADLIIFLYREAYYLKDKIDDDAKDQARLDRLLEVQNKLEAAIAKNRNGPTCTVDLFFDAGCNALSTAGRW
ncbi:replicative DNA helicase [Rhodopseudomonas sp. RCAM05734]|uniref:replicative DNA helicase n=1 Tax=Rhodopseudomonas sp. RCAM05734 TaxID=3457549 RepID=UPI004044B73D